VTLDAMGGNPLRTVGQPEDSRLAGLTLPEDLAMFRSYLEEPRSGASSQGVLGVEKVK
jgi:hypothetical protein